MTPEQLRDLCEKIIGGEISSKQSQHIEDAVCYSRFVGACGQAEDRERYRKYVDGTIEAYMNHQSPAT